MEITPVSDVQGMCRLCDGNTEKMYNIFSKTEEGHQILQLIRDCTPVIVYRTDPLSKQICQSCYKMLSLSWDFRKNSIHVAKRHRERLLTVRKSSTITSIQLFLGCQDSNDSFKCIPRSVTYDASTSTEDLVVLCSACKTTITNANNVGDLELCTDLHKAIADSLKKNKVITEAESEKMLRSRRKRPQAFYHELDDSLCSSLTEFTNTESSHCFDFPSDVESYDSEQDITLKPKRRRIEQPVNDDKQCSEDILLQEQAHTDLVSEYEGKHLLEMFAKKFENDVEYSYYPLSLLQLSLNVINKTYIPECEYDDFQMKISTPRCTYCSEVFQNSKILALHEVSHMNIELGDKVDNPILWHVSRDDAEVRNKWLTGTVDNNFGDMSLLEETLDNISDSLLIPIGTDVPPEHKTEEGLEEIILVETKPTVNGILLSDYSKEERKAFYATMRVGGVNKKFCRLCRYSFKDNWAIESHYFSSACYYTCRYCGMRFNKQRHRFKEHVLEHEKRGDPLSNKVYAASKLSNVVPKVIQPAKVSKVSEVEIPKIQSGEIKSLTHRRSLQPNLQLKEELGQGTFQAHPSSQFLQTSQSKTGNQAYFCRKCYKVFFKLDEFNGHSRNCDFNQFSSLSKMSKSVGTNLKMLPSTNGDVSSAGRPIRNCVKEIGTYKDEVFIPEALLKESSLHSSSSFVCFICNTPFPTIYSRNSHMRIHKGETGGMSPSPYQRLKTNTFVNIGGSSSVNNHDGSLYSNYFNFQDIKVKQEPLEPEVEIHESEQNFPNVIGAVSITPISKNPNQKPTINPNIMKLVQNNPHLTIKGSSNTNTNAYNSPERFHIPSGSQIAFSTSDSDKSYKCSNCWEAFSNKSHLYFHKKNQCEGSRFPCPFCKKRFGTEAAYSSHIFYSHPE